MSQGLYEAEEGGGRRQQEHQLYITLALLERVTGHQDLRLVKELDLQYQEDRREKIKAIEGLMNLSALRKLNLSGHAITKIEGLAALQSLVHLDLAFNTITNIANLDSMRNLQYLNLAGNHIQHIPKNIKALSSLTTLKLDYNNLASLRDVTHLTPLKNLVNVGMHGNPLASLPHYHLFVTFHVPHLDMLDTSAVTSQMRTDATQLFKEQEHETLQTALDRERDKNTALEVELAEMGVAIAQTADKEATMRTQMLRLEQRCQALQGDLSSKSSLLESKSVAFIDASRSLSALEQEFEFYKIDHPWPGQRSLQAQGQEKGQVAVVGQQTQFQLERELGKMKYQHEQKERDLHSQLDAARRDAEVANDALKQAGMTCERSSSSTKARQGSSELVSPASEMQELALGEKVLELLVDGMTRRLERMTTTYEDACVRLTTIRSQVGKISLTTAQVEDHLRGVAWPDAEAPEETVADLNFEIGRVKETLESLEQDRDAFAGQFEDQDLDEEATKNLEAFEAEIADMESELLLLSLARRKRINEGQGRGDGLSQVREHVRLLKEQEVKLGAQETHWALKADGMFMANRSLRERLEVLKELRDTVGHDIEHRMRDDEAQLASLRVGVPNTDVIARLADVCVEWEQQYALSHLHADGNSEGTFEADQSQALGPELSLLSRLDVSRSHGVAPGEAAREYVAPALKSYTADLINQRKKLKKQVVELTAGLHDRIAADERGIDEEQDNARVAELELEVTQLAEELQGAVDAQVAAEALVTAQHEELEVARHQEGELKRLQLKEGKETKERQARQDEGQSALKQQLAALQSKVEDQIKEMDESNEASMAQAHREAGHDKLLRAKDTELSSLRARVTEVEQEMADNAMKFVAHRNALEAQMEKRLQQALDYVAVLKSAQKQRTLSEQVISYGNEEKDRNNPEGKSLTSRSHLKTEQKRVRSAVTANEHQLKGLQEEQREARTQLNKARNILSSMSMLQEAHASLLAETDASGQDEARDLEVWLALDDGERARSLKAHRMLERLERKVQMDGDSFAKASLTHTRVLRDTDESRKELGTLQLKKHALTAEVLVLKEQEELSKKNQKVVDTQLVRITEDLKKLEAKLQVAGEAAEAAEHLREEQEVRCEKARQGLEKLQHKQQQAENAMTALSSNMDANEADKHAMAQQLGNLDVQIAQQNVELNAVVAECAATRGRHEASLVILADREVGLQQQIANRQAELDDILRQVRERSGASKGLVGDVEVEMSTKRVELAKLLEEARLARIAAQVAEGIRVQAEQAQGVVTEQTTKRVAELVDLEERYSGQSRLLEAAREELRERHAEKHNVEEERAELEKNMHLEVETHHELISMLAKQEAEVRRGIDESKRLLLEVRQRQAEEDALEKKAARKRQLKQSLEATLEETGWRNTTLEEAGTLTTSSLESVEVASPTSAAGNADTTTGSKEKRSARRRKDLLRTDGDVFSSDGDDDGNGEKYGGDGSDDSDKGGYVEDQRGKNKSAKGTKVKDATFEQFFQHKHGDTVEALAQKRDALRSTIARLDQVVVVKGHALRNMEQRLEDKQAKLDSVASTHHATSERLTALKTELGETVEASTSSLSTLRDEEAAKRSELTAASSQLATLTSFMSSADAAAYRDFLAQSGRTSGSLAVMECADASSELTAAVTTDLTGATSLSMSDIMVASTGTESGMTSVREVATLSRSPIMLASADTTVASTSTSVHMLSMSRVMSTDVSEVGVATPTWTQSTVDSGPEMDHREVNNSHRALASSMDSAETSNTCIQTHAIGGSGAYSRGENFYFMASTQTIALVEASSQTSHDVETSLWDEEVLVATSVADAEEGNGSDGMISKSQLISSRNSNGRAGGRFTGAQSTSEHHKSHEILRERSEEELAWLRQEIETAKRTMQQMHNHIQATEATGRGGSASRDALRREDRDLERDRARERERERERELKLEREHERERERERRRDREWEQEAGRYEQREEQRELEKQREASKQRRWEQEREVERALGRERELELEYLAVREENMEEVREAAAARRADLRAETEALTAEANDLPSMQAELEYVRNEVDVARATLEHVHREIQQRDKDYALTTDQLAFSAPVTPARTLPRERAITPHLDLRHAFDGSASSSSSSSSSSSTSSAGRSSSSSSSSSLDGRDARSISSLAADSPITHRFQVEMQKFEEREIEMEELTASIVELEQQLSVQASEHTDKTEKWETYTKDLEGELVEIHRAYDEMDAEFQPMAVRLADVTGELAREKLTSEKGALEVRRLVERSREDGERAKLRLVEEKAWTGAWREEESRMAVARRAESKEVESQRGQVWEAEKKVMKGELRNLARQLAGARERERSLVSTSSNINERDAAEVARLEAQLQALRSHTEQNSSHHQQQLQQAKQQQVEQTQFQWTLETQLQQQHELHLQQLRDKIEALKEQHQTQQAQVEEWCTREMERRMREHELRQETHSYKVKEEKEARHKLKQAATELEQREMSKRMEEEQDQHRLREAEEWKRVDEWRIQVEVDALGLEEREHAVAQMENLCAQEAEELDLARVQHKKKVADERATLEALEVSLERLRLELVEVEADLGVRESALEKRIEKRAEELKKQQEDRTEAVTAQRVMLANTKALLLQSQTELTEERQRTVAAATLDKEGIDDGMQNVGVTESSSIIVLKRALVSQRTNFDSKVHALEIELARLREEATEVITVQGELRKLDLEAKPVTLGSENSNDFDARVQALKNLSARVCSYVAVLNRQLATCRAERNQQAEWETRRSELEHCEERLSILLQASAVTGKLGKDHPFEHALTERLAVALMAEEGSGMATVTCNFHDRAAGDSGSPRTGPTVAKEATAPKEPPWRRRT